MPPTVMPAKSQVVEPTSPIDLAAPALFPDLYKDASMHPDSHVIEHQICIEQNTRSPATLALELGQSS